MAEALIEREVAAPREVVFDVICDLPRYSEFTPIRRAVLEHEGRGEPCGVGAVRALHLIGPPVRERVLAFERPRLFSYELISGQPVRELIGTVELSESEVGTLYSYRIAFEPLIPLPGLGAPIAKGIELALARMVDSVAEEAERRARADG